MNVRAAIQIPPTPNQRRAITKLYGNPDEPKSADDASKLINSLIAKARTEKYQTALKNIPAPGEGRSCHSYLFHVARCATEAGIQNAQAAREIYEHVPAGGRILTFNEVKDAVEAAYKQPVPATTSFPSKPRPAVVPDAIEKVCRLADGAGEPDLCELSPIKLPSEPRHDTALLLETVYEHGELVFIGDTDAPGIIGETIRSREQWLLHFDNGGATAPHIMANPLTGQTGMTKMNRPSLRADSCVSAYRHIVIEHDSLSRDHQFEFWFALARKADVAAIIDSGNKSLHGWLRAKCDSREQWEREVEQDIFPRLLSPLGFDASAKNEGRMSRLPGHLRAEKGKYQRLLYLAPPRRIP